MKYPRVALDLMAARHRIVTVGWCSEGGGRLGGPHCAVVSIYAAVEARVGDTGMKWGNRIDEARILFARPIGIPDGGGDIGAWNDTPGRTEAEVLSAFDAGTSLACDGLPARQTRKRLPVCRAVQK